MHRLTAGLILAACCTAGESTVPYGHPDFYPSSERPLGWRGDGTGAWPGANIVSSWDAPSGKNIIWKAEMPGAAFAQPLVIGEKVITNADPDLLVCVNVHDGKILWTVRADHTEAMPVDQAKTVKTEQAFLYAKWLEYGQWLEDAGTLAKKITDKGFDGGALWWDIKAGHVIHEALNNDTVRAAQDKFLADAEIKQEFDRLKAICLANGFIRQKGCNGDKILTGGNLPDPLRKPDCKDFKIDQSVGQRLRDDRIKYDLWLFDNWEGYTTWNFATPCTDGEFIYTTTVNNAIGCYDLDGKKQWLVWDHPAEGNDGSVLHCRYVPSPFLAGNTLVVNQNAEIRAFDTKTGRKLWSVVKPYGKPGKRGEKDLRRDCRPTPEACSPTWARLPLDGSTLDVVVDAGGNLYRLDDGKVVGTGLPRMGKGASPICVDDLYVWKTGSDNRPSLHGVVQMVAKSKDQVDLKVLWEAGSGCKGSLTNIVFDGKVYYSPDKQGSLAFDLKTGATTRLGEKIGGSSCSPIIAGDQLVQLSCGDFGHQDPAQRGLMGGSVMDLKTGAISRVPAGFQDLSIVGDSDFAKRNRNVGCGNMISNASPCAQANRLFFRTKGYLWCIGEKSQKFPVPKDCPPQGRVK